MSTISIKLKCGDSIGPPTLDTGRSFSSEVNTHMSFLEMLDVLNERLEAQNKEPIVFEHDCGKVFVDPVAL